MSEHTDDHSPGLLDRPRPHLAVATAVLTVFESELCVALVSSGTQWRLPGTLVREGETLADAVRRCLRDKAGINGLTPTQLHVFDAPGRDSRGWVVSVAHLVMVPPESLTGVAVEPVNQARGLAFDHDEIIDRALARVRSDYADTPDPAGVLGDEFTLRELQRLHEAVAGGPLMRDTFRRSMESRLAATGNRRTGGVGKPARLFRRIGRGSGG
ncbi:NUDIX domain-containing protein [Parafrigoribacterium mesophilum]|uniref:NUDIX hydrolase n=1 Tax=Parafrigoribacterium mesophilum TaxID=433646 RepID=UPI0031FBC886